MKKIIFFIVMIFGICIFLDLNSFAHSGRTDSSGGHNCSAKSQAKGLCTGYHYHNEGYSLGMNNEKLIIPTTLATVHIATFKSGFKKGEQFYKETQNEKYYNLGYNDGEIDKYVLPDIKEKEFLKSYKKGHSNRQKNYEKNT